MGRLLGSGDSQGNGFIIFSLNTLADGQAPRMEAQKNETLRNNGLNTLADGQAPRIFSCRYGGSGLPSLNTLADGQAPRIPDGRVNCFVSYWSQYPR